MKYNQNLRIEGNRVISYSTHVATLDHSKREVTVLGYWSRTTSKHIDRVCSEYGYKCKV